MSLSTRLSILPQKEHRGPSDGPPRRSRIPCTKFLTTASPVSLLVVLDDVVYDAVVDGLVRTHYVVAVGVALDPVVGLPRVLGEDLIQAPLGHDELLGVDLHVGGLPREAAHARLVQEDPRVRQRVP